MFCTNCGAQIADGSVFCPNCGAALGNRMASMQGQPSPMPAQAVPVQPMMQQITPMQLLNIDYIPGKQIQALGLVKGNSAQSRNVGKDFMAGLKNMVGGEVKGYSEMTSIARQVAMENMMMEARQLGADAIVNIRYDSASLAIQGIAEVMVYGTAVKEFEEKTGAKEER